MERLLRKMLRMHSPSGALIGTCRCRGCKPRVGLVQWFRNGGFSKPPTQHIARVKMTPGKTTLVVLDESGNPTGLSLILVSVTWAFNSPTEAVFHDNSTLLERRRA